MNNVILSPIPLDDLKELFRQVVQEELGKVKGNENPAISDKPITTKELADYLGLSEQTIIRMRKKGKIPFFTIGTAIRHSLQKVLESLEKKKKN